MWPTWLECVLPKLPYSICLLVSWDYQISHMNPDLVGYPSLINITLHFHHWQQLLNRILLTTSLKGLLK